MTYARLCFVGTVLVVACAEKKSEAPKILAEVTSAIPAGTARPEVSRYFSTMHFQDQGPLISETSRDIIRIRNVARRGVVTWDLFLYINYDAAARVLSIDSDLKGTGP